MHLDDDLGRIWAKTTTVLSSYLVTVCASRNKVLHSVSVVVGVIEFVELGAVWLNTIDFIGDARNIVPRESG